MMRIHIIGLIVVAPLIITLLVQTGQLKRSYPYTFLQYRNMLVVPSTPMYLNATLWDDALISFPDPANPYPVNFPQTCDSLLWDTATFCLQPTGSPSSQLHMFKTYGDGAIYAMQGSLPPTKDTSCGFYPAVCPLTGVVNDACAVMYNTTFSDVVVSTGDGLAYCSSTPDQSSFFAPPITCQNVTNMQLTCPLQLVRVCLGYAPDCNITNLALASRYDFFIGNGAVVSSVIRNTRATAAMTGNINASAVYINTSFSPVQANFDTLVVTGANSTQMQHGMICFPGSNNGVVRLVDPNTRCIPEFEFILCSTAVPNCVLEQTTNMAINQTVCTETNCTSVQISPQTAYLHPFYVSGSPNWTISFDATTMGAIKGTTRTGAVSIISSAYVTTTWACVSGTNNNSYTAVWTVPQTSTCESALRPAPPPSYAVCIARVLYCNQNSPGYYTVSQYNLHTTYNVSIPGMVLYINHTSDTSISVTYVTSDGHTDTTSIWVNYPYIFETESTFSSYPLNQSSSSWYMCITPQGQPNPTVAIWTIDPTTQSCLINGLDINLMTMQACVYHADPSFIQNQLQYTGRTLVTATNYSNGIITYEQPPGSLSDDNYAISGPSWQIPVDEMAVSSELAQTSLWPQVSPLGWYCDFFRCTSIRPDTEACIPPYEATNSFIACIYDEATSALVIPAQNLTVALFEGSKYAFLSLAAIGSFLSDIDYAIIQTTFSQTPSLGQYVASAIANGPGMSLPLTPISGVGGESCFRQGCDTVAFVAYCLNAGLSFCVVFNENDTTCPLTLNSPPPPPPPPPSPCSVYQCSNLEPD